jgi:hypothetical protein
LVLQGSVKKTTGKGERGFWDEIENRSSFAALNDFKVLNMEHF